MACPGLALSTYPDLLQRAREHADGIREKVIIILALLTDPFRHEESQATSQVFPALPQQVRWSYLILYDPIPHIGIRRVRPKGRKYMASFNSKLSSMSNKSCYDVIGH